MGFGVFFFSHAYSLPLQQRSRYLTGPVRSYATCILKPLYTSVYIGKSNYMGTEMIRFALQGHLESSFE